MSNEEDADLRLLCLDHSDRKTCRSVAAVTVDKPIFQDPIQSMLL